MSTASICDSEHVLYYNKIGQFVLKSKWGILVDYCWPKLSIGNPYHRLSNTCLLFVNPIYVSLGWSISCRVV